MVELKLCVLVVFDILAHTHFRTYAKRELNHYAALK
jgi:hypothetical protein